MILLQVKNLSRQHLLEQERSKLLDQRYAGDVAELQRNGNGSESEPLISEGEHIEEGTINIEVAAGEVLCVVGPSGAGKSTLLKAISGLIPIQQGDILLKGQHWIPGGLPAWRSRVRYVAPGSGAALYMEARPIDTLNGFENLKAQQKQTPRKTFWQKFNYKKEPIVKNTQFEHLLSRVALSAEYAEKKWNCMSSGELQRASICIALALPKVPEVLLLDEPTSACDPESTLKVEELISDFCQRQNCGVIWVSHDMGQVSRLVERGAKKFVMTL